MYAKFWKRFFDFTLSLLALIVLSPVLLVLIIVGAIAMRGNPFFVQARPGKIDKKTGKEKIFKLIKFRTMSNKRDKDGNLLPDAERLNGYGKFLRKTSLDELGELVNIVKGDMAIVGPRPLLNEYLPYYSEDEHHRHDVRPGLTGWAQVNGRNYLSWEEKFAYDIHYVQTLSFIFDLKIIYVSVKKVIQKKDVADVSEIRTDENGNYYIMYKGEKMNLHEPMNVERGLKSVIGNRK